MNLPISTPPPARRNQLGSIWVNRLLGIKERTGVSMPADILLTHGI